MSERCASWSLEKVSRFSGRFRLRSRGAGRKRRTGAALEVGFEVGFEAVVLFGRQVAVAGGVDESAGGACITTATIGVL